MGKKRVAQKGSDASRESRASSSKRSLKKKVTSGTFFVQSTYNNTKALLSDKKGNTICWSSSGALGFRGAKKGTPFAAAKIGETIGEKATQVGMQEANVVVKGVGAGRDAAIRAFAAKGVDITAIVDETPVPWNGPQPPKPRRV